MRFRPALFIGLGDFGSEIARRISARIRSANPVTEPLVGLIELRDDGRLLDGISGSTHAEIALAGMDSYASRFSAIASSEDAIGKALRDGIDALRRSTVLVPLREGGVDVAEETALYFVAPLGDDVGSPALIAFLEIVGRLRETRLAGQTLHRTALCFFPDLFPDHDNDERRFARSFVCLQELEFLATQLFQQSAPFDYVSLFTARNEANEDLGSYSDIADVLGDAFLLALRREITVDESFAAALLNKTPEGMVTRYSSVGMARLVFPRDGISRVLAAKFAADVLHDYGFLEDSLFDRHVVSSDVRKYIYDGGLDRIGKQLELDESGKPIWKPFTTRASFSEDADLDVTLTTLRQDADNYERNDVSVMTAKTRETRARLLHVHQDSLTRAVASRIDSHGSRYAHAFLDVLLNQGSDYTTGDIVDNAVSVDDIDRGARSFFDELFGVRRAELSKLRQDINSKETVLAQHELSRTLPGGDQDKELATAIDSTQTQLKKLQREYGEHEHRVKTHDLQLQDGSRRRDLLLRHRSDVGQGVRQQAAEVQPLDADYRDKRRAHHNEETNFKERKRALLLYGLYVAFAIVALVFAVRWFVGPVESYWPMAAKAGAGLFIFYAGWAAFEWLKAKKRVVAAFYARTRAADRKRQALSALRLLYEQMYRVTYDFTLHGAAVDWANDFKNEIVNLKNGVQSFQTAARNLYEQEEAAFAELIFSPSLLARTVATREDLEHFLSSADTYGPERLRVRTENPRSNEFHTFRSTGNLDGLIAKLRRSAAEVFSFVRSMSIETFLTARDDSKRTRSTEKIAQLFHFGTPLIQLRIPGSNDQLRNVTYFGCSLGEQSSLVDLARRLGREPQVFRTSNDTEFVVVTTKVGFPAFHVALIAHCDRALEECKDSQVLKTVPDRALPPLIPSSIVLGGENDPVRQLALQSLALGIVDETSDGIVFEEQIVGHSYRGFIEALRSLRGAALTARLQVRTAEAMRSENVQSILLEFLQRRRGDEIDQQIIQGILDRLEAD